jgi:hypothetical protein
MAAPCIEDNSILRRELPNVTPNPRSIGDRINLPKVSLVTSLSISTLFGMTSGFSVIASLYFE